MAGEIYIADKPTLDLTKINTDVIKTNTEIIKNNFPIETYTPYEYEILNRIGEYKDKGKEATLVNISGKGYFESFICGSDSGSRVKITIDGNVIHNCGLQSSSSSSPNYVGICQIDGISYRSDASISYAGRELTTNIESYPYVNTNNEYARTILLNQCIPFEQSLKIELTSLFTLGDIKWYFWGGIKK